MQFITGTSADTSQLDIFRPIPTDFINTDQELVVLTDHIAWDYIEELFAGHCSHNDQPAIPIRYMVGWLHKRTYDYGDENLAIVWVMKPYMRQNYFFGAVFFKGKPISSMPFPAIPANLFIFESIL